jgi:phage protein D
MGAELEIKFGYVDSLVSVGKAEVVSIEFDCSSDDSPHVTVRGYDLRHRLRRGTKTRSFANMKDSDIAGQIASDNGLTATAEDSRVTHENVYQNAKSDLEFLRERADQIGYEVMIEGSNLYFGPPKGRGAPIPMKLDADLTDLNGHIKANDRVGSVEVRGWDPEEKKIIVGRSGDARHLPQNADSDTAFGKAELVIVDSAITKQDEADRAAVAALENQARQGITIEGSCPGRTDLRAGVEINLLDVGSRFSGVYRLTSVTHKFTPGSGYGTSFSGTRKLT